MKNGERIAAAVAFGAWGGFNAWFGMKAAPHHLAKDFTWPWRAARVLLEGHDPYQVIQATGAYPFNTGLFYPLPAGLLAIPFAPLPPALAGTLFVVISAALLAWGLTAKAPHHLFVFASAPFCMAALLGQWSPILTAAALLPSLQFVCAAKPTIGFAAWLYQPSLRGALLALALVAISLVIQPQWPLQWLEALRGTMSYRGPALTLAGCFTLLAALRWRRREGRLFLGMVLAPQLPLFYDQLPLWLVPSTVWRSAALSALSWVAWFAWYPSRALETNTSAARIWILLLVYAPALLMLLALPAREEPAATAKPADPVT